MKSFAAIILLLPLLAIAAPPVGVMRVPNGGVEPQVAARGGIVHMVYFKGDENHGDLFYIRSEDGEKFTKPVRVNSEAGSALAIGAVRGAQLSIGKSGRVHVVWNGSRGGAMFYARSDGDRFEPQRNLAEKHNGVDGGGSVAADDEGNVYVVWHAPPSKNGDEATRRVWLARSDDDGQNFKTEIPISESTGACACCAIAAGVNDGAKISVLYRSANGRVHRDIYLLTSTDRGKTFSSEKLDEWEIGQCVMSTASIGRSALAFESHGQIVTKLNNAMVHAPDDGKNRKHPAVATNARGETLLAWTEGTSWNKGGSIAWRVYDSAGKPLGETNGHADGLPVWGWVTAFAKADGSFVVVY